MAGQEPLESIRSCRSVRLESLTYRARNVVLGAVAFIVPFALAFRGYLSEDVQFFLLLGYLAATAFLNSWLMMGALIFLMFARTMLTPLSSQDSPMDAIGSIFACALCILVGIAVGSALNARRTARRGVFHDRAAPVPIATDAAALPNRHPRVD